ncbi:MAG: SRPBCC family protein [Ornithinimicrobium sp.]
MGQITLRARGPGDAATVWERYARPDLWQTWAPHIRGVAYAHERLVVGAHGHVIGPLGLRVPFVLDTVVEPERAWSWTVSVQAAQKPVLQVRLHHTVEPLRGGSETTLRLKGPILAIVGYAPIARFALHRLTRR